MKYKATKDFGNIEQAGGREATSQALRVPPYSVSSESNNEEVCFCFGLRR